MELELYELHNEDVIWIGDRSRLSRADQKQEIFYHQFLRLLIMSNSILCVAPVNLYYIVQIYS